MAAYGQKPAEHSLYAMFHAFKEHTISPSDVQKRLEDMRHGSPPEVSDDVGDDEDDNCPVEETAQSLGNQLRRLKKRLRQVEQLRAAAAAGLLNAEQEEKVKRSEDLEEEIASVEEKLEKQKHARE